MANRAPQQSNDFTMGAQPYGQNYYHNYPGQGQGSGQFHYGQGPESANRFYGNQTNVNSDYHYGQGPVRRYRKSGFLLFIFSAVPGLNYMYLGLMKRGLFFMTLFFATVFVANEFGARLLMFGVFILMCFSLFDGFKSRRLLMDGFVVSDAAEDIIAFFKKHWLPVSVFAGLAFFAGLAGRMSRAAASIVSVPFAHGGVLSTVSSLLSFAVGLILIVGGCYIAAKIVSRNGEKKD